MGTLEPWRDRRSVSARQRIYEIIDFTFEYIDLLIYNSYYIYYWLWDIAPIVLKYKLMQFGRDGIDMLPFLSWETKQEIKRWLMDYWSPLISR
jgi:hypothetical protein